MIASLTSDFFHLFLNPNGYSWNLQSCDERGISLKSIHMKIEYMLQGKPKQTGFYWRSNQIQDPDTISSPLGELNAVEILGSPDSSGIGFKLCFAIANLHQLFLWKCSIINQGKQPIQVTRITLLETGESEDDLFKLSNPAFFSNGWGSWNHTGVFGLHDHFRRTKLGVFSNPMRINQGTPQPRQRGVFASDMYGVLGDRQTHKGILAGFLSQEQHFGTVWANLAPAMQQLSLWANGDATQLDPGNTMETDWACIQQVEIDNPDPFGPYLRAAALQAGIDGQRFNDLVPAGWCSWYHFYTQIKPEDIRSNLLAAKQLQAQLPLSFIQIDDGFEARVGDWFKFTPSFANGVQPLAQEISLNGFTPGLWLAPFIVDRRSQLARQHPDWLLRGRFNLPVNAGFLWNRFATALDLTNPPALDYACQVVETAAHEWGFPYLKLDFLYAGALPGQRSDFNLTRAQVLRQALQALRQVAGEQTFLLGCGCPLGSGLGLVDAMRIGADVDRRWKPAILGKDIPYFHDEPDLPSARNAIQNTLTRSALHKRWWINDPDCLLLRETTQLTLAEIESLASVIALSGGLWVLSDHLPDLSPEKLKFAQVLLPTIGKRPQVLDWFEAAMPGRVRLDLSSSIGLWHLLALFNWQDEPGELDFNLLDFGLVTTKDYWLRDFWQNESMFLPVGKQAKIKIPAHGVRLFAARQVDSLEPVYIGSDLHISQGLEVKEKTWTPEEGALDLILERPGKATGLIELSLPGLPHSAYQGSDGIQWVPTQVGSFQFPVHFERQAHLHITCMPK